ncbi:MAG: hypothetical protein ACR2G7_06560 [Acidimicrobiales bacterium]
MDVQLGLDVARDGSGQVRVVTTLDPEAAGRITDLSAQLMVDDLRAAGWTIDGPERGDDGSTVITASKPFANPEGAGDVLEEVGGSEGPFHDLEVTRRTSFLTTSYAFSGTVDLRDGVDAFSDEELRRQLEGSGFGLGTAELEQATGAPVADTFGLEVRADLPGSISVEEAAEDDHGMAVWRPSLGQETRFAATSSAFNLQRLVWLMAAAFAALAALAILLHKAWRRP